jgi:hypothetical protein
MGGTRLPEDGLTYSVGLTLGGATAQLNQDQTGGTATGKDNVVAATALAVSFAAPYVPGLVGVGILGEGYHAEGEAAFLDSLPKQAKRSAVLMERLVRTKGKS